ncbi:MAG: hypothetical protein LKJ72_01270 [[Lactobacillus] timonensis]|jgi:hypothetical protein|uniref:hypothetical protein n=1 Tax=[Lactobacillus] timonensis TaxID=1970790 RepID=UPI002356A6BD|nr:hypothetical protein [[Lactobacillus] timonensis]MCI1925636.1 hypothetical protein [[Lactobacillus] timonensis]MCI1956997.1 hypothetical protein [[Lactobacillus] timonensis]MCI1970048.1 hypothetical protein [[Lactobacillus] timonensis]MCI2006187.1 hypothetical protein [[Lactobacillus] timonensis]
MHSQKHTVNFLTEILKFREWRGNHKITPGQAAVFSELQAQCNFHGFKEWFPVSISKLHDFTHLSNRAIYDARNVLKQKGLIDFKKGKNDSRMAMYKIVLFDEGSFYPDQTAGHSAGQSAGQTADQTAGQTSINKNNRITNNTVCMSDAATREKNDVVIPIFKMGGGRK